LAQDAGRVSDHTIILIISPAEGRHEISVNWGNREEEDEEEKGKFAVFVRELVPPTNPLGLEFFTKDKRRQTYLTNIPKRSRF
jgi:hypothetical protein